MDVDLSREGMADEDTLNEIKECTTRLLACIDIPSARLQFQWLLENFLKDSSKVFMFIQFYDNSL